MATKNKAVKVALGVGLAAIVAATSVLGVMTSGFTDWNFGKSSMTAELPDNNAEEAEGNDGGMVVTPLESEDEPVHISAIRTMSLAATTAVDDGIAAQAETSYTLTATITPEEAAEQGVKWSIAWKDPSSAWATGKIVTDYVTVTPVAGNSLQATVANLKAFGEPIIVKADAFAVMGDNELSATCQVDYSKRITGYESFLFKGFSSGDDLLSVTTTVLNQTIVFPGDDIPLKIDSITPTATYSDYTIDDDYEYSYKISFAPKCYESITNYGGEELLSDEVTAEELTLLDFKTMNIYTGAMFLMSQPLMNRPMTFEDYYDSAIHNPINKAAVELNGASMAQFEITATGSRNTYSKTIEISVDNVLKDILGNGITLDYSNLIF